MQPRHPKPNYRNWYPVRIANASVSSRSSRAWGACSSATTRASPTAPKGPWPTTWGSTSCSWASSLLARFAAAVGALLGGTLADAIGRRRANHRTRRAVLRRRDAGHLLPGGGGEFNAVGYAALLSGRIVLGLAVGGASSVVPIYLAELAPYEIRGSITGRNELAIVAGQLAAFVVNALIAVTVGETGGVWRIMFAVCAVPAVCLFFGMLRMPESPRWLVEKGRTEQALRC